MALVAAAGAMTSDGHHPGRRGDIDRGRRSLARRWPQASPPLPRPDTRVRTRRRFICRTPLRLTSSAPFRATPRTLSCGRGRRVGLAACCDPRRCAPTPATPSAVGGPSRRPRNPAIPRRPPPPGGLGLGGAYPLGPAGPRRVARHPGRPASNPAAGKGRRRCCRYRLGGHRCRLCHGSNEDTEGVVSVRRPRPPLPVLAAVATVANAAARTASPPEPT